MEFLDNLHGPEGHLTTRPPLFDGQCNDPIISRYIIMHFDGKKIRFLLRIIKENISDLKWFT